MTRKSDKNAERQARLEALRREEARRNQRRLYTLLGAGVAIALVVVFGIFWLVSRSNDDNTAAKDGQVSYSGLSRDHVEGAVAYDQTPPAGGAHSAQWQNCGIYTSPIANENAVHSLEHGAFWITYQPDLPGDQVKTLQDDVRDQPYGLLSPYPDLPAPIVATVWGTQLRVQDASDPRLADFIDEYADATQAPEPKGEAPAASAPPAVADCARATAPVLHTTNGPATQSRLLPDTLEVGTPVPPSLEDAPMSTTNPHADSSNRARPEHPTGCCGHCHHEILPAAVEADCQARDQAGDHQRRDPGLADPGICGDFSGLAANPPPASNPPAGLFDVHSRFAKAHLRTHTQRAVYFTLVAQIADSWSAAEIATLKHLDAGSVEAVLDHYVAAGVVDLLQTEAGNRYRWRSDMAYLVEDEARVATTLDPVCGMTVTAGTPYWLAEASGELWLFCSELCLATFRAKPRIHRPPATTPSPQTTARDPIVRPGTLPACERQLDIAVFLLGALTPAEERDLISHATTCPSCQASLSELGDLPDLLARVPPAIAESINLQTGR